MYGISKEEYEQLFLKQDKRCAICKSDSPGWSKGWHLDHNHETDQVRGILCHPCNLMIGLAKEKTEVLIAASVYLKEFIRAGK